MNANIILNGDNAMIAMAENGMRLHASGTVIKAPTIAPSGTLRRFVVLRVVLVDVSFKVRTSYQMHLRDTHKLGGQDVARYVPVSAARAFTWGKRKCPFDDCARKTTRKEECKN